MITEIILRKGSVFFVAFLLLFFPLSSGGAALDLQVVDDPGHYFGELEPEHAIAVATDGTIFIAYGGDNLYLASKKSGNAWRIETVDSTTIVGKYPSIALDSSNYPHISYHEDSNGLRYARWDGSSWHVETVDSTGRTGKYTAIVLDSNNRPHISYHNDTTKRC